MKLYYRPGSSSLTIHLTLEVFGLNYQSELIAKEDLKSPEYLKLNPQGLVPCIVDDDETVVTQNLAILQYLDAKFPQAKIFGAEDLATKTLAWRWLAFCNTDLHKSFVPIFHRNMYSDDAEVNAKIKEVTAQKIKSQLALFEAQLNGKDYLAGNISAADLYLFVILRWARHFKFLPEKADNLNALFDRLFANPSIYKILEKEGLLKAKD